MAEHRARAAREDGGHPAALTAYRWVPHRVDAGMDAVEPSGSSPPVDRPGPKTQVPQLRKRDHPKLPSRHPRHLGIDTLATPPIQTWLISVLHTESQVIHAAVSPRPRPNGRG